MHKARSAQLAMQTSVANLVVQENISFSTKKKFLRSKFTEGQKAFLPNPKKQACRMAA
jgi:hypothetical protein